MKKQHIYLLISLIVFALNCNAQGYGISNKFYIKQVSEKNSFSDAYWKKQVKKLSRKSQKNPDNSEYLYALAIAKQRIFDARDAQESIKLLNKAIELDSTKAKYYAVRGIIKYDWGVWSQEYTPSDGCIDINKAIELGLSEELKNDEAIIGIPTHPNCK